MTNEVSQADASVAKVKTDCWGFLNSEGDAIELAEMLAEKLMSWCCQDDLLQHDKMSILCNDQSTLIECEYLC